MKKAENRLESNLNINKFATDQTKYYELDVSQDWVRALLVELNENATDKSIDQKLSETSIQCNLEITRKNKTHMGNYILVQGTVSAQFLTECIRTLTEMKDSVEVEVKACFVSDFLEKSESFKDQTDVLEDNELFELYFYAKNQLQIAEMIHEQVYLEVNQYPIIDEESPLVGEDVDSEIKQ